MPRSPLRRRLLAVGALVLFVGTAVVVGAVGRSDSSGQPAAAAQRELPRGIARLEATVPIGNEGLSGESPTSFAEQQFVQLAYPRTDIPLAEIEDARADMERHEAKAAAGVGTWASVGPRRAVYQRTPLRTAYVPNEYAAAGRTTAIALSPRCTSTSCRLWVASAGGGVWRTNNAFASTPTWTFLSPDFGMNAIGAIAVDPSDPSGNTLWVGTGEANACAVCAAGVGLYKSTDGGNTWTGPFGEAVFRGRAIGSIAIHPSNPGTLYVSTTRGVRGISSVSGGAISLIPGAPRWGLYKTTDGGASWTFVHNGSATSAVCTGDTNEAQGNTPCSPRGVRRVRLDPSNPSIVYASSYARGIWRSNDAGATWVLIRAPQNNTSLNSFTDRAEFDVVRLSNGRTRMYVGEGSIGNPFPFSKFARSDDVATAVPVFLELTSPLTSSPGYGSYAYCDAQCWYDQVVLTSKTHPDVVYLAGDHAYGEEIANYRGLVLSRDAGQSWTDMTEDATDATLPNGLHPDHHGLVVHPRNAFRFISANDGGLMRSNGTFSNISANCDSRGLSGSDLERCRQMLSAVPTTLKSINPGLSTIQFMSLSVSPFNVNLLQGGTQDNGTFQSSGTGAFDTWKQTMWGDGGQSGFDATNRSFRFHTFFLASPEVNFEGGDLRKWLWISDRIFNNGEPQAFYIPIVSDPKVSKTMFAGLSYVWRTKTAGQGSMTMAQFQEQCNTHTGKFEVTCGDWEPLSASSYDGDNPPPANGRLTGDRYGSDRTGGQLAAVERAPSDVATLWAATSTGRVFISKNVNAAAAGDVDFTRIDGLSAVDPNRFVSSIVVDPANPNHAWLSYSGFNGSTPTLPGHVFEVTYNPVAGTATWNRLDGDLGDIPVTDLVRDHPTGDLYASTDLGVLRLPAGSAVWQEAAAGLPTVAVAGLTIVPSARVLYAATHGLGAWRLTLP